MFNHFREVTKMIASYRQVKSKNEGGFVRLDLAGLLLFCLKVDNNEHMTCDRTVVDSVSWQHFKGENMKELLVLFLDNLCIIGVGMAIFICAFLSNMSFSIYRNISILHEGWSWEKFWEGITKAIAFLVGLTLLCLSVTAIPFFAEK